MNTNQYSQAFQTQLGTQGQKSSSDFYGQGAAAGLSFQDFGSSQDNSYLQFTEFSQVRRPALVPRARRGAACAPQPAPGPAHRRARWPGAPEALPIPAAAGHAEPRLGRPLLQPARPVAVCECRHRAGAWPAGPPAGRLPCCCRCRCWRRGQ
jgi:hypothetical protein